VAQLEMAPRVAMLRHTLFRTSEVFIPDQASKLASSVTLVARDKIVNPRSDLKAVSFAAAPASRIAYTLGFSAPLADCLRALEAEVLHAHFGTDGLYSYASASRLKIPHVTTLHGSDVALTRKALLAARKPVFARYAVGREKFLRNPITTFVCVSRHVQRLAVELGANPDRTVVIPTGVDTRTIAPTAAPESPTLVHVARLVDVKGTATLIRAMARVVMLVPDVRLRIVGDGPLRHCLSVLADDLEISRSVTFTGALPHSDVLAEIAAAQVLVAPSETVPSGSREGLGQAALEAGALGRPVVATDHGGLREAVADGVSGILVAERNPEELAAALVNLLTDRHLRESLGRNAVDFVRQNYDVARGAAALDALYQTLLRS
jgi:colanic acid/amylovoran biosynthesis glycosyltransferase